MENRNTFIVIAISAILSSACTAAVLKLSGKLEARDHTDLSVIESQIHQLESTLALETQARMLLETQLNNSQSDVATPSELKINPLDSQASRQPDQQASAQVEQESQQDAVVSRREQRRAQWLNSQQLEYRQKRLVSAGFGIEEAARIIQIESEASLQQLQAQYDSRRQAALSADNSQANTNSIRTELGDQNYERYLQANGWPTSARIGSVIGGSPGENAGLRAGDKVTSYAGERVFNLREINNLTIEGEVGESVLIEVEREGNSVQLTIPRGPIGINNGGRRRFGR